LHHKRESNQPLLAHRIVDFYTLSSFTLAIIDLPAEQARRLPRHDVIPAALIGRLARDEIRNEGVGDLLLAGAVRRMIGASRSLAVFAIEVEATDEKAAAFYRDIGFAPFQSRPLRMLMVVSEAAEAVFRALSH
jgi:GNAT superfamily N-acetyltransferase